MEIGDDRDEHALDADFVKGASEVMVVDQVFLLARTDDHRDHVGAEKLLEILRVALLPRRLLHDDLAHAERHLRRAQFYKRRGVQDGFAKLIEHEGRRFAAGAGAIVTNMSQSSERVNERGGLPAPSPRD